MTVEVETRTTDDLAREASDVIASAIHVMLRTVNRRAETCGCPGCRADALRTVAWASRMVGVAPDGD